jgi:hypothetical protein
MNVDGEGHVKIYSCAESCGGAGKDFLKYQAELTKICVSSNMCVYTHPKTPVILNIFVRRKLRGGWEGFP